MGTQGRLELKVLKRTAFDGEEAFLNTSMAESDAIIGSALLRVRVSHSKGAKLTRFVQGDSF
jgi:hypothetical protein